MLSYWEKSSFFSHSDVIIAGGGYVGLWSAYYLKKKNPRLKITIIERGFIPQGASTRNAGFACFGSVTELMKDVMVIGEENMLALVEMRYSGLSRIAKTFKKKEIEYADVGGYELIPVLSVSQSEELVQQAKWLNKTLGKALKQKKIFRFADEKIDSFGFADLGHIISNELEGYLHPGKLCQLLAQQVQSMGVNILPSTEILQFETSTKGVAIYTNHEISLNADRLLVCTNGFAKQLLPELEIIPARGQVLVTSPIEGLKFKGTFHYDEGFYYFRNIGNRLLLGGARNEAISEETTTEMSTTTFIQNKLDAFIRRHLLPGTHFEVTDRWSGIMAMGSEKMPIIKKINQQVYCAVRMSGMGVALAPVAGELVAELMEC